MSLLSPIVTFVGLALGSSLSFCLAQIPSTDVPVRASRESAWTSEQSRAAIQLDGDYEAQLVAAEPLVRDPVEMCWDEMGRCFVADMIDYPLGPPVGEKPLSRIQQLVDENKDGQYDKAITFAEHLDHVQGLLPFRDGLIATTRTQILVLRDTNGDGKADEIKSLVEGFNPTHSQLQVSAPRWGLDNKIYFNNGLDTKEIYPTATPDKKQNLTRSNLCYDPATGTLSPATGFGQFGGCFDDWGRHFFSSNRSPIMYAVMPYAAVVRNPHAGITQGWEDIAPTGAEAKVYPLQLTHTTADAHAGTHTAACGLGVYRGDLMPELRGEIFVCEPTAQAVVRYHVEPNGASLKATRVGDHREFLGSKDEWCRPVNITTGPDGALYVCDIYRQYIDHARFFPEEFQKTHNLRMGENEGRIWRIVPKGKKARAIEAAPMDRAALVAWLGHANAWQRETAQRLLVERGDVGIVPDLIKLALAKVESPAGKLHAASVLCALKADDHLGLFFTSIRSDEGTKPELLLLLSGLAERTGRRTAFSSPVGAKTIRMAYVSIIREAVLNEYTNVRALTALDREFYEDIWVQRAVLSAASGHAGSVLERLVHFTGEGDLLKSAKQDPLAYSPARANFFRALASTSAANANKLDVEIMLKLLAEDQGGLPWWKSAILQGLTEGLPKSSGKLGVKSLAEFANKPPAGFEESAKQITALLAQSDALINDAAAPMEQRLSCLPMLAQRGWDKAEPTMRRLLTEEQPVELKNAALALFKSFPADKAAPLMYELLPKLGPAARQEVVKLLTSSGKTVKDFFERIERGEIPKSFVDAETRWRYLRPNQPLHDLAEKIFGQPSADRAAVMSKYTDAATKKGDAQKGHQIFSTVCIVCHRVKGEGMDVGPDITDVRIKEKAALLSDILDPNRMVEARWMAYQIDTKDNRAVIGLIAAETPGEITVKMAGGIAETIPRANIAKMKCLDTSLMPMGLEGGIDPAQMADLLTFLKGE